MAAGGILSLPFIYLFVGWVLIPRIMQLNIGSAGELLDKKLGGHLRILASILFLIMRLVWMSVIISSISHLNGKKLQKSP
jgi:SSS family solute:Na+ symporter